MIVCPIGFKYIDILSLVGGATWGDFRKCGPVGGGKSLEVGSESSSALLGFQLLSATGLFYHSKGKVANTQGKNILASSAALSKCGPTQCTALAIQCDLICQKREKVLQQPFEV